MMPKVNKGYLPRLRRIYVGIMPHQFLDEIQGDGSMTQWAILCSTRFVDARVVFVMNMITLYLLVKVVKPLWKIVKFFNLELMDLKPTRLTCLAKNYLIQQRL